MNGFAAQKLHPIFDVTAVFAGGNALGAYHLGVCEGMTETGLKPSWLVGASIGAVTAALYAGGPTGDPLQPLRTFWDQAAQPTLPWLDFMPQGIRSRLNNENALTGLLFGRPGVFRPRYPGPWSLVPGVPSDVAVRDLRPLARSLESLVDFDRLNDGKCRVSILALDVETGEEVWFDNRDQPIRVEHLLASCALAPLFPPVEIEGRLLCDAGLGNNLPFDRVFHEAPDHNILCIASDLFHPDHGRPETLDQTVARAQDLAFAIQTRRSVAALARERELVRQRSPESPSSILAHLAYQAPGHQRGLKTLDFSSRSIKERAAKGRSDFEAMLPRLHAAPQNRPLAYLGPDNTETNAA
ncbi:MAG: patatin-like phospholipase family protein [Alphaproteobacteria bacterium]|nr:patatin-like phospholipase family protein [Alphaproteobacteria bacterium]